MDARKIVQLWQCIRDQTEQIEKIGPPHILFFFFFFGCYFLPCFVLTWTIFFSFVFFMFTIFGTPDIERRKKKGIF